MVGRRHLDQRDVHRQDAGAEQPRYLGEAAGGEIRSPLFDGLARRSAKEESIVTEALLHPGLRILGAAHRHHVDNFHIAQLVRARHQRLGQSLRLAGSVADNDAVA